MLPRRPSNTQQPATSGGKRGQNKRGRGKKKTKE